MYNSYIVFQLKFLTNTFVICYQISCIYNYDNTVFYFRRLTTLNLAQFELN